MLLAGTPTLTFADIQVAFNVIQSEETAKLIGQLCHLAHWRIFGHFNSLPLDPYHMQQLFVQIVKILKGFQCKAWGPHKGAFKSFIMPMIVLAIRMEATRIFTHTFPVFFSKPQHEVVARKLINDVLTQLIDPNMYYSRLSFFESGRKAIHIKVEKHRRSHQLNGGNARFYTRSALV